MNLEQGSGITVCKMRNFLFLISMVAVTVYLIVVAIEDHKTCEVTRWKHFIGFIPAFLWFVINVRQFLMVDLAIILAFLLAFICIGYVGIYGLADGFVFAILLLLFGGVGGITGIGVVILIMILACFSGMTEMLLRKIVTAANFKQSRHIAFIPHILTGYTAVMIALFIWGY